MQQLFLFGFRQRLKQYNNSRHDKKARTRHTGTEAPRSALTPIHRAAPIDARSDLGSKRKFAVFGTAKSVAQTYTQTVPQSSEKSKPFLAIYYLLLVDMKTTIYLVAIAALLCGCNKPSQWEYKTVEVDNSIHGYLERAKTKTSDSERAEVYRTENSEPGDFGNLEIQLAKIGDEGWELVGAVPELETPSQAERLDGNDLHETEPLVTPRYKPFTNVRTGKIILIFKRPAR
ncbi:MAG: hypothetical protein ABSH15_04370 [Verrucomicrobiota bacterium]